LKISFLVLVIPDRLCIPYVLVFDGSLSIIECSFIVSGVDTVKTAVIVQRSGSTKLNAVYYQIKSDSYCYFISGIILSEVSFVEIEGGIFEISGTEREDEGTSLVYRYSVKEIIHCAESSKALFLNARSSSESPITRISFSHASFLSCLYGRPKKETDIKEGGLITVLGLSNSPIVLVLEDVEFSTIEDNESPIGKGIVNGGAIYGKYLSYVLIKKCFFNGCSVSSGVGKGSGGALYIEEVSTSLNDENKGMNSFVLFEFCVCFGMNIKMLCVLNLFLNFFL
jgi:hypothetical protein